MNRPTLAPFAWLLALVLLVFASPAHAVGTVRAEGGTTIKEADARWKLKLAIDYGSLPDVAFVPMIFSFQMQTLYERSYTDEGGDKPIVTKKALSNQQPINESMDVGFSDGTGKSFKVTKFNFMIRRDRGFEAGEYTLQIKRADDGALMGQKIRIVLEGDNAIVDRRSISFVGGKPEKKKDEKKEEKPASDAPADGEPPPGGDAPPDDGASAAPVDAPPPVPPSQGGCGCRVTPVPVSTGDVTLGALALAAVGVRLARRRRSAAR